MSLRFFCDHCVSNLVMEALRNQGFEVIRLKDFIPVASSDRAVIAAAQENEAVLVSLNGDFTDIVTYPPQSFKEIPPYTHNLNRLIELGRISLPPDLHDFVNKINLQSVPTRYPEDFHKLSREYNKKIAEEHLKLTRRTIAWLKRNTPKLRSGR